METKYILSESQLIELLTSKHTLTYLKIEGVENWGGYMANRERYIADYLDMSWKEVKKNHLSFEDCAKEGLQYFKKFKEE